MPPSLPSSLPHGFTLIEMLIAIAVVSLLVALGMPQWHRQAATAELRERAEALAAAMARARSEAILRGARVDVCPSEDHASCSATAGWEAGWVALVDVASGSVPASALSATPERAARSGITIRGNAPVARYVSYTSLGVARRHDGALQMGTFTVCRPGHDAFKVILANSGRTRIDATREQCP